MGPPPYPRGRPPKSPAAVVLIVLGCVLLACVVGGAGLAGLVALADDSDDDPSSSNGQSGADAATTPSTLAPAEAAAGECISVTSDGGFLGTGSCAEGGAAYRVLEVIEGYSCTNPDSSTVVSGAYTLCLEVNLVENYCYSIPEVGWIESVQCELPGTVHVIDVVPGVEDDTSCTTEFDWNGWYAFDSPKMVACVMQY